MRTALMEMAKPKTERAAWVPESILDDDVSHFMGAAAAAKKAGKSHFNFGGKKYKVTMKHDTAKKVDESASCDECGLDGECQCEQPVQEAKVDEVSYKTAMKSYQKAMGQSKDADTAGDKKTGDKKFDQAVKFGRYATKKFKSSRNKKKLVGTFTGKESVEENYTDKQDASYREPPVKSLAALKKRRAAEKGKKRPDPLRNTKPLKFESVEEAVSVKKKDYSWGRMMTVHHGTSHSYPLHPEHQSAIKKLGDNQKTSFKDETGTKVTAHRQGDTVHLSSSKTRTKTPVAHSHFKESVKEVMDPKDHVKYNDEMEMYCVYNKDGKVVAKFKDEEDANNYAMKNHDDLMEAKAPGATAQHSATKETSDTFEKQMSAGEGDIPMGKKKDFVKQHEMEVGLDAEKIYQQNKYEALSKTPARPGDKPDGDKTPVNPVKVDMVDGMRKALAQMKLSGD